MGERSIWGYLAWVGLGVLLVWSVLKMLVFIEMPLWLRYSPWVIIIYLVGWGIHATENIVTNVYNIKKTEVDMVGDINNIKTDLREERENENLPLPSKKK